MFIKRLVLSLPFFIILFGCQDVGKAPTISTIYIDENINIPTNTETDQPSIDVATEEILEKRDAPESADIDANETSIVEEKIVGVEKKSVGLFTIIVPSFVTFLPAELLVLK